ncbi:unnamed protein product [Dicrocoelium dendriticum]|nr:unnamed protein product [Dicrocoelium dendriticum]
MPRRYPLLGTEDPQEEKAKRPFTMRAEQEIWDLGDPVQKRVVTKERHSEFAMGLKSSKYPFVPDHTAPAMVPRLAWLTEIQSLDYALLLPDLIEGLTDREKVNYDIAMTAITDIFKHGPTEKVIDALPTLTIAVKKAFAMNNIKVTRRVIEALRRMCVIEPGVGPDLAFYMHEILVPLNFYFNQMKNQNDQIVYNETLYSDLYDPIDGLVKLFLRISGPELDTAERNIKKAIPVYQISREP